MADAQLAKDYLEFPDRSLAYYGYVVESLGDTEKLTTLEPRLLKALGSDWRNKKKTKWCNISKLIKDYLGTDERTFYWHWSHFVHSSAVSIQILKKTIPTQDQLDKIIETIYKAYCLSTSDFLEFAWGPVITNDSQNCKNEFIYNVMGTCI
jgi:hypothetical protein